MTISIIWVQVEVSSQCIHGLDMYSLYLVLLIVFLRMDIILTQQLLKGVCSIFLGQKEMEIYSAVCTFENKWERMVAGLG